MLAFGICIHAIDDYYWTSESIVMECMKKFYIVVQAVFREDFVR